jgi:hypothetical protein
MRARQTKGWIRAGIGLAAIGLALAGVTAIGLAQPAFVSLPAGASVKIAQPMDGASVVSPVHFVFEVKGASIKPAGPPEVGTGHHHVLVDQGPMPAGEVVPADMTHLHYGKGQTDASVTLTPGEHTVTLQFADGLHRSYGPAGSHTIKIKVKEY